jgi:polyhydroxyalkanoate synthesis regulator phasin
MTNPLMPDTAKPAEAAAEKPVPPKRSPGHRGADVRDTVAEMAAKAHEISLEAGSKMAAAMKEVIGAAAGLTAFAIESARDLVQYMVRRGQMTQDEADKLIREAEAVWARTHKGKAKGAAKPAKAAAAKGAARKPAAKKPAAKKHAAKKHAAKKPARKPAAKKHAAKKPAPKK